MSQNKPAYRLFNTDGKSISYKKSLKLLQSADVVCFGELHNNAIAHWLEYEYLQDLAKKRATDRVALAFEMFETDQQPALDSLQAGSWDRPTFEENTDLWPNYATDYRPLVDWALASEVPVIAANAPRRYARQVAMQSLASLDSLPADDQALLAPLPITIDYELPSYANMREMMSGHGGGMSSDNFIAAQAIKDATMAYRILQALQKVDWVYHVNGSYHSDYQEGIMWFLLQQQPGLSLANLTVVEQTQLDTLEEEHLNKADVIIVVPATMTKTYTMD